MTETCRILIYRCGAIGDTIVAIPAMRAIRERYPQADFLLMTAGGGENIVWTDRVLRDFGWFESVITYEAGDLRSPLSLWRVVRRVRALAPDIVFYLGSDKNSALKAFRDRIFFLLSGVSRFVGTSSRKVTAWGWLRRAAHTYPFEVDRLLADLRRQGVPATNVRFDLPIAPADVNSVDRALKGSGMDAARSLVAMCPGSKQPIKVWPEDRFAEVGRRLIEDDGLNIAIVGGSDEAVVGARLVAGWPHSRAVNLAQKLSILESAELMRRCVFYLGNDTGAMHIAASVGTRCVAIFAAREAARSWHPYGENHVVLRKSVSCQNCYLSECRKEKLRCLLDISVADVLAACQRLRVYR